MRFYHQEIASIYLKNSRYNNLHLPGIIVSPSLPPRKSNPNESYKMESQVSESVFEAVCLKDVGNLTESPSLSPLDAAARASFLKPRRKSP